MRRAVGAFVASSAAGGSVGRGVGRGFGAAVGLGAGSGVGSDLCAWTTLRRRLRQPARRGRVDGVARDAVVAAMASRNGSKSKDADDARRLRHDDASHRFDDDRRLRHVVEFRAVDRDGVGRDRRDGVQDR